MFFKRNYFIHTIIQFWKNKQISRVSVRFFLKSCVLVVIQVENRGEAAKNKRIQENIRIQDTRNQKK